LVPSWSRDGQSIYFCSTRSGSAQMWKQSIHGGGAVQITQHGGFTGFESYDGKTLYYAKDDSEGLWSVPVSGGAATLVTPALRSGYWGAWAVSETGIYLIDNDVLPRPTIEFYNFRTRRLTAVMQIEYSPSTTIRAWTPRVMAVSCSSRSISRRVRSPWWRISNDPASELPTNLQIQTGAAQLDYIDNALLEASPLIFQTLVDSRADSQNHAQPPRHHRGATYAIDQSDQRRPRNSPL
jgi:WD40-like Beta Propeller Repeat